MRFYQPETPAIRESRDEALHPQPSIGKSHRFSGAQMRRLRWERIKLLQHELFLQRQEPKPIERVQRGRVR